MHALLLWLALGQAEPAPLPAAPEPPPRSVGGLRLRAIDFTRLEDGTFRATLDGEPVAGAAFYRAVLRPDLADQSEQARNHRTALFIAAGVAPVAGLGAGWVWATAQRRPVPDCVQPIPTAIGGSGVSACEQVKAQNRSAMTRGLSAGGFVGLAAGVVLASVGTSIHPRQPTADEAEALVRDYRARGAPVPTPAPYPEGPATRRPALELEAGPRAVRLALRFSF